ncbi:MAG: helix-turn-helix transcriptional regulator [Pseudomonadota bacterium]
MRKAQDLPVLRAAAAEIKSRRASLKISQEELAHRAGVHRSFVARLEIAETQPSLAVFFRLAEALEVDVVELTQAMALRYRKEVGQSRRAGR